MSLSQTTDPVTEIEVLREIRGLVVRVLVPPDCDNRCGHSEGSSRGVGYPKRLGKCGVGSL